MVSHVDLMAVHLNGWAQPVKLVVILSKCNPHHSKFKGISKLKHKMSVRLLYGNANGCCQGIEQNNIVDL